jgi:hypothetical protein
MILLGSRFISSYNLRIHATRVLDRTPTRSDLHTLHVIRHIRSTGAPRSYSYHPSDDPWPWQLLEFQFWLGSSAHCRPYSANSAYSDTKHRFLSIGYKVAWPNIFCESTTKLISITLANRVGVLAFANIIVVILSASRSNPLLHLTQWPYGTFMLLHRWAAYSCILHATIHTLVYCLLQLPVLTDEFNQTH